MDREHEDEQFPFGGFCMMRSETLKTGVSQNAGGKGHSHNKMTPIPTDGRISSPAGRRLSAVDAAFLYLERKEIPLSIASVCVFDGPVPFNAFVASIESKLDQVPRWRQVVAMPALNVSLPTWQPDPHFDIRRHILRATLEAPGGQAELEA